MWRIMKAIGSFVLPILITALIVGVVNHVALEHALASTAAAARPTACQRRPMKISYRPAYSSELGYAVSVVIVDNVRTDARHCGGRRMRVTLLGAEGRLSRRTVWIPRHGSRVHIAFAGVPAAKVNAVGVFVLSR